MPGRPSSRAGAAAPGGAFLVTWEDYGAGASAPEIKARLFDSSGLASGPEFQVNNFHFVHYQIQPSVAADAALCPRQT